MTTEKQRRARTRNWNKTQLKGVEAIVMRMLEGKEMYDWERLALDHIISYCKTVLGSWEPKPPTLTQRR